MSIVGQARQLEKMIQEQQAGLAHLRLDADTYAMTGYEPRPLQAKLESQERRFNVEVMHRRFGKTVFKINKLIDRAAYCPFPDGRYAYFAPTYGQAKDIAWHHLKEFTKDIPGRKVEESELAVWIPSHIGSMSRIKLYGLDNPKQRIRGLYLDGCVFDEYAWMPQSSFSEQVRPMLTDKNRAGVDAKGRVNQWADFIFTPFGRNHAYTRFQQAEMWARGMAVRFADPLSGQVEEVKRDDWFAALYKASETGVLDDNELASARIDMGHSKYEQEYECSFDAAVEGSIYAREIEEARTQGRIKQVPWNKLLPVHTAWDLGFDDATAIWFYQQYGESLNVIDYYEASGAGLDHYADILAEKGYRYGTNSFPHDVDVHELGTGKSRASILRGLGVRVSAIGKISKKADAIEAGRLLLSRANFDHEKCAEGVDRLALYRREYDEKNDVFREKPTHDWASHGADAWQTLALGIKNAYNFTGYTQPVSAIL